MIFAGLFVGLIIDIAWWKFPSLQKRDKFQAHEHYHVAIEFTILYIIVSAFTELPYTGFLLGLAIAFLLGEWDQLKEIVGTKVKPGHPFALGSSHFASSAVIGIGLAGSAILLYFYLPTITV